MQLSSVLALAVAAVSTAYGDAVLSVWPEEFTQGTEFTAVYGDPPLVGTWNSYSWPGGDTGFCAQFCNDCTSLGWTCWNQDNGSIAFNKAFIYKFVEGQEGAPCC